MVSLATISYVSPYKCLLLSYLQALFCQEKIVCRCLLNKIQKIPLIGLFRYINLSKIIKRLRTFQQDAKRKFSIGSKKRILFHHFFSLNKINMRPWMRRCCSPRTSINERASNHWGPAANERHQLAQGQDAKLKYLTECRPLCQCFVICERFADDKTHMYIEINFLE